MIFIKRNKIKMNKITVFLAYFKEKFISLCLKIEIKYLYFEQLKKWFFESFTFNSNLTV